MFKSLHDRFFRLVHQGRLIYNCCWEDPALDRDLLELGPDARVVVITSAGCNALEYLLDDPVRVDCVDMNYRQNALLELKKALILHAGHYQLWALFGRGADRDHERIYSSVRRHLPDFAKDFWDRKIGWFSPEGRGSFYYRGAAGDVAYAVSRLLWKLRPELRTLAMELLEAKDRQEQERVFAAIEPRLWSRVLSGIVRQPWLMAFLGVPRPQIDLIVREHPDGLAGFVRDRLRHVLTRVPIGENYFWRVYLTGSYTPACCPNYLKPENFEVLRERVARIHTHTDSLSGFLRANEGSYSHFVLLDHQDWMARHVPLALREEWGLILERALTGARVLLRSAGGRVDFIPEEALARLAFRPDLTEPAHPHDRVGTYGSQHLAEVG